MIQIKNAFFSYPHTNSYALENVSLSFDDGQMYAVMGRTGSGKSTLMRCLNGLIAPQHGSVCVYGLDTSKKGVSQKTIRQRVGLVFQYPEKQLFAETVLDDIAFGPRNLGLSEHDAEEKAREAAKAVNLSPELFSKSPFALSGGEKRRAAIAGVLASEPDTLVFDEPTSGLDPSAADAFWELLSSLSSRRPEMTVIFVTHSPAEAVRADSLIIMSGGKIAAQGAPAELLADLETLKSAGLLPTESAYLTEELRLRGTGVRRAFTPEDAAAAVLEALGRRTPW